VLLDRDPAAIGWFEKIDGRTARASWPQLVFIEIANAFRTGVRARKTTRALATEAMERALRWPIAAVSLLELAPSALDVALDRGLTTYDACYVVLAELRGATLVTADRTLAAATPNAVLLD
jgi:predicted nucleic acid-binding protein